MLLSASSGLIPRGGAGVAPSSRSGVKARPTQGACRRLFSISAWLRFVRFTLARENLGSPSTPATSSATFISLRFDGAKKSINRCGSSFALSTENSEKRRRLAICA
eukprot:scaffold1136_cov260-Pinguiococcus_pyrenoidosus.AAC.7